MKIENGINNKVNNIDVYNSINQYNIAQLKDEGNKDLKSSKINKKTNRDIYQNIRTKATIINSDQRDIQDKISLVQAQEEKIQSIEETLKQTKNEYIQAIQNGKNEEVKHRIKVRQLKRQINELKNQDKDKEQIEERVEVYKKEHIQDESKIIAKINDTLHKINSVKAKLSQYKSELVSVSESVETNKKRIEAQENDLKKHLDDSDYIISGIIINTSSYIDLEGNLNTGIIIDIYI